MGPFASEVYRAPVSYPFRDGLSGDEAAARAISVIDKQVGAANLAAVIIEPILGEGGFIVPADGFLNAIADWCTANGVVFIADEVQTGFTRTGAMFASELFGIVPDLITTAKGIAGGLPLAAVTGRAEIMDATHAGGLGGTYGGNPIACAAALAAIEAFETEGFIETAKSIGEALFTRLARHPGGRRSDRRGARPRGHGRGRVREARVPRSPTPALASAVAKGCIAQGVVVLTCGTYGNIIRFLPPLTIPDELLAEGLDVVADVLAGIS